MMEQVYPKRIVLWSAAERSQLVAATTATFSRVGELARPFVTTYKIVVCLFDTN